MTRCDFCSIINIISRETIGQFIDSGEAYRIMQDGKPVGGVIISVDGECGDLEILFVSPKVHSKGIGYAAWCEAEKLHPEVKVWETVTPYFEKRNIHFYVNRCGFILLNSTTATTPTRTIPICRNSLKSSSRTVCFGLKREWINNIT